MKRAEQYAECNNKSWPARLDLYRNWTLAAHAAHLLQRMTGDTCRLIPLGPRYRVVRVDPTGKEVEQT